MADMRARSLSGRLGRKRTVHFQEKTARVRPFATDLNYLRMRT